MNPQDPFEQALEQLSALPLAERLEHLHRLSRERPELRQAYLRWLLQQDFSELAGQFDFVAGLEGFTIIRLLGHGSSSAVYLARQEHPRRLVALKVLYQSHSEVEKRRFLREAEYLALLDHPGIASVYSAGEQKVAGHVLHYIVMEFVDGRPIKTHAETAGLNLPQRIELVCELCDALAHAHRKGILHRDIKPDNVLVDGRGRVRLVDFGIGKNLQRQDGEETRLTEQSQILGTLAYMSPEQIRGGAQQLSTQSDVYSLGVLAYELLTGELPFDIQGKSLPAAVERILADTGPARLRDRLPEADGDLERVITKAMAKDPGQRYTHPEELARDLRLWLAGEPVQAGRPSSIYHIRQFVRRNKALVATLGGLFIATLLAAVIAGVFAYREAQLRVEAAREAERADAINQVLTDILQSADPDLGNGRDLTVLQVIEQAGPMLNDLAEHSPRVGAALHITLAEVLGSLGELERSARILARSREAVWQSGDETLRLRWEIARARNLRLEGRHEQAEQRLRPLQAVVDRRGLADPLSQAFLAELASVEIKLGQDRAETHLRQLLKASENGGAGSRERYLEALHNLALLKRQTGELSQARALCEQVVEEKRRYFGPNHPMTLYSLNLLASVYSQSGDHARAEAMYRQVLTGRKEIYGKAHPLVRNTRINLLNALISRQKLDEADQLSRQLLAETDEHTPADQRVFLLNMRAYLLEDLGRLQEAETLYRQSLTLLAGLGQGTFVQNHAVGNNLAMLLMRQGRLQEAENEFRRVLTAIEQQGASEHYIHAITENNLGECLRRQGRFAAALELLQASHTVLVSRFGAGHTRVEKSRQRMELARQAVAEP